MKCFACEDNVSLPFKCKFCSNKFCEEHRLPENHDCPGLKAYKEKKLSDFHEGRKVSLTYSKPVVVKQNPLQPVIDLVESNPNFYLGVILLIVLFTLLLL